MPYDNVPAELFMEHDGVRIYHIYKNDMLHDCERDYWFSLWAYGSDDDSHGPADGVFDVRRLPNPDDENLETTEGCQAVIAAAITARHFDSWEHFERKEPKPPVDRQMVPSPLYKTTIVIWSDFDPTDKLEIDDLARRAMSEDCYCSKQETVKLEKPEEDSDWDGTEFFWDSFAKPADEE